MQFQVIYVQNIRVALLTLINSKLERHIEASLQKILLGQNVCICLLKTDHEGHC